MDALKSFLDWFEGFSDNIEEQPSKAQWDKVKGRIARLGEEVVAAPHVSPVAVDAHVRNGAVVAATAAPVVSLNPSPPAAPVDDTNLAQLYLVDEKRAKKLWRERFEKKLMEIGINVDRQTARDVSGSAGIQWDLTPEQQAEQEVKSWSA